MMNLWCTSCRACGKAGQLRSERITAECISSGKLFLKTSFFYSWKKTTKQANSKNRVIYKLIRTNRLNVLFNLLKKIRYCRYLRYDHRFAMRRIAVAILSEQMKAMDLWSTSLTMGQCSRYLLHGRSRKDVSLKTRPANMSVFHYKNKSTKGCINYSTNVKNK